MPDTGPLAEQNLKDRYYGVNDPVAAKLMSKADDMTLLAPPEDQCAPCPSPGVEKGPSDCCCRFCIRSIGSVGLVGGSCGGAVVQS